MLRRSVGDPAVSRDLAQPVERQRLALAPAERAEIDAGILGQQVGVKGPKARVTAAHDFSPLVDVVRGTVHADAWAQVDDPLPFRPDERPAAAQGVSAGSDDLAQAVHRLRLADVAAQRAELVDRDYRRPSCVLAHIPASTAVSALGPSNRRTRMVARPLLLTATRCRIETWPSAGVYFRRSCAPPASPAEPRGSAGRARALYSSTQDWSTSIASFCGPPALMPSLFPLWAAPWSRDR